MPEICRFYGIIITMYFQDHFPAHFHINYGEYNAVVAIKDLRLLKGGLPPKEISLVMEWAVLYKEELLNAWDKVQKGKPVKIEPLK